MTVRNTPRKTVFKRQTEIDGISDNRLFSNKEGKHKHAKAAVVMAICEDGMAPPVTTR